MTTSTADTLLAKATARLVVRHGFFGAALLRKRRVAAPHITPTMGTAGGVELYYNPAFVDTLTMEECMGALAHEALHDLLLHPYRRGTRHMEVWNVACDTQCNHVVQEAGLTLPEGCVPAVGDSTAEEEYEKLMKDAKKHTCTQCSLLEPRGADGKPLQGAARSAAEADAKLRAAAALEVAKRAGTLPAGLARLVEGILASRVPWAQIVQRFVTHNARATESAWRRPNRRYLSQGIVLPSVHAPEVPDFVLACDTSGSIDQQTLQQVASEALHALATCQARGTPTLTVVWCDTVVHTQEVQTERDVAPRGGGGTMFSPAFSWIAEHRPNAKGVVYVTDGCCEDFGPTPAMPVLWVLTAPNSGFAPPFGELVCIMQ